jgi:hypothetical protein
MMNVVWVDVVLGLWLIASPWVLSNSLSQQIVVAEDFLPGIVLIATSLWILAIKLATLRVSWLQALSGLWLIVGSFVFVFMRLPHAALNVLIVGVVVLAVYLEAMWTQTRRLSAIR